MPRSFDPFDRVLLAIAVAIFAGLAGMAVIEGLVTGAIDGPARGHDLVAYARNPQLFLVLLALYGGVFLGGAALACMLFKHRNEP